MSSWLAVLQRSCDPNDHAAVDAWFARIADRVLSQPKRSPRLSVIR